jgi:hypothetical protein
MSPTRRDAFAARAAATWPTHRRPNCAMESPGTGWRWCLGGRAGENDHTSAIERGAEVV